MSSAAIVIGTLIVKLYTSIIYGIDTETSPANSAGDNLVIFFQFFSENRISHFMQIVPFGDSLHKMPNSVFWEK